MSTMNLTTPGRMTLTAPGRHRRPGRPLEQVAREAAAALLVALHSSTAGDPDDFSRVVHEEFGGHERDQVIRLADVDATLTASEPLRRHGLP